MAISRIKTFITGEVLTAGDLNSEYDNPINNALSLISPLTGSLDFGANTLLGLGLGVVGTPAIRFTGDTNTGIYSTAADTVDIATGGVRAASFGASVLLNAAPEDARTNTVDVAAEIRSTTSGTPAANIGTGLLFSAESADENPSSVGQLDFVFTDVTAASEDSVLDINLRTAGAALGARYRLQATGANLATFTHANTATRTYTFPDSSVTLGAAVSLTSAETDVATSETTTSVTYTDLATAGPAVTLSPGSTATHVISIKGEIGNNTSGEEAFMSVAIAGVGALDIDSAKAAADSANNVTRTMSSFKRATSQTSGATHTSKYKVSAGTGTFKNRRIVAWAVA